MRSSFIDLLAGFVLCVSINSFISALIAVAVGKMLGFRVWSFKYLFFDMSTVNREKQFHFGKFSAFCQYQLLKWNVTKEEDHKQTFLSLILTTLVDLVFIVGGIFLIIDMYRNLGHKGLRTMLEGAVLYLIQNVIYKWITTIRFVMSEDKHLYNYTKKVTYEWMAGVPMEDLKLPPYQELGLQALDAEIIPYNSLRFLQKVWLEQWDELETIVQEYEDILNKTDTRYGYLKNYISAYYNLIFYYSFVQRSEVKARHFYQVVSKDLANDRDTNGRRVLAYYQYFVNHDVSKARSLIEEGRRLLPKFSITQSERDYEEKLLNKLSDMIDHDTLYL